MKCVVQSRFSDFGWLKRLSISQMKEAPLWVREDERLLQNWQETLNVETASENDGHELQYRYRHHW